MEAGSASEEISSRSVKRMSLSLPFQGYGNTFVDEREKNRTKRIYVHICLCFSEQNDIQSLNDVNLYKGKDVFVVQYGKNDNKLFVTTMNSNESNFQKLQNHTATWTNAKISQLATNGLFVSDDAKDFINQSGITGQGKLPSAKLQEFTNLNIPQISNAQDFIDGLSELSTDEMTL